ncbi:MAG: sortase, partial [Chloroflexota bacterium]
LPELREGDEVILYRGDAVYRYRVELRTIVREEGATEAQRLENARWMDATEEATCTLISCYPYRVDTHRVIVRARLVE